MARADALRSRLTRPMIIAVDGATAYWLESAGGHRLTAPAPSSANALAAVAAELDLGSPVNNLVLVCCLEDGNRYEIGAGEELVDAALAAAGRPRARKERRGTASA